MVRRIVSKSALRTTASKSARASAKLEGRSVSGTVYRSAATGRFVSSRVAKRAK